MEATFCTQTEATKNEHQLSTVTLGHPFFGAESGLTSWAVFRAPRLSAIRLCFLLNQCAHWIYRNIWSAFSVSSVTRRRLSANPSDSRDCIPVGFDVSSEVHDPSVLAISFSTLDCCPAVESSTLIQSGTTLGTVCLDFRTCGFRD